MAGDVPEVSVLIVGAGPTGLALACDLARRNVDFRIIDKAPEYFVGSRGKGLQPRSLEVLDDLGLVETILANGRFHLPFRAYEGATVIGDRDMHEGRHPTPDVPYASSLIIPQWRVEETLRHSIERAGKHVELTTELASIEQDDDGVTATLQTPTDKSQVRCRYLAAADGGHSFVRRALQVGFEGETWKDERMFVGDVRVDGLDRDHWHAWPNHPDGVVALCPLPSTEAFQFQAQILPTVEEEPSLEAFQHILTERTGRHDLHLYDPTWMSLFRANVRMVDRYRVKNAFLAGDAAHVHSPAGGQGMNTGIQDAYNLGWKLDAVLRGADESLLDTYEEERLPVAAAMLGITSRLHRQIFTGSNMQRGPETLQLGINYRDCSLSREAGNTSLLLRAGDRAPDAPILDESGNRIRLFDVFRGPRFVLMALGNQDSTELKRLQERYQGDLTVCEIHSEPAQGEPGCRRLVDDQAHVRHAYGGETGAIALVRPDGYIGWIGDSASLPSAQSYLQAIFPEKRQA
jgi:2-polyprenyl-6-methoxyphenol hydroxylase-like FAD-dependent oxidoreductase